MGVPDWIFSLECNKNGSLPGGTYCYVGEITRERGFMSFIADYLSARRSSETLVLVGTAEKEIFDRYGDSQGLIFTGRLPQRDALAVVRNCEYAISTIPYCRPYNVQTPTKLLEYAALGQRIICNDSPSNLMAIRELGIQCMVTGPRLFSGIGDLRNKAVPANNPSILTHLRWGHVIAASGVERYLTSLPLDFQMSSEDDDRKRDAKLRTKDSKQSTLFLMRDVRGGGAELVTLNIVSGIVARGGTAKNSYLWREACRSRDSGKSNEGRKLNNRCKWNSAESPRRCARKRCYCRVAGNQNARCGGNSRSRSTSSSCSLAAQGSKHFPSA